MSGQSLIEKLKQLAQAGKEFLTLPDRLYAYSKEIVESGGVEVESVYTYQAPDHSEHPIRFRTSIQPDGDIINFIPDPQLFATDPRWNGYLNHCFKLHFQEVGKFYKDLEAIQKIGVRVTQMVGSLIGTISALFVQVSDEIQQLLAPLWMPLAQIHPFLVNIFWFIVVSIAMGIASGVLFFYILKPALFKIIMSRVTRKMGKG